MVPNAKTIWKGTSLEKHNQIITAECNFCLLSFPILFIWSSLWHFSHSSISICYPFIRKYMLWEKRCFLADLQISNSAQWRALNVKHSINSRSLNWNEVCRADISPVLIYYPIYHFTSFTGINKTHSFEEGGHEGEHSRGPWPGSYTFHSMNFIKLHEHLVSVLPSGQRL